MAAERAGGAPGGPPAPVLPGPEEAARWRRQGLRDEEYARIVTLIGREPNDVELGMFAVLWSEHCAYKHSRPLLRLLPGEGPGVLLGPGENAGAVEIGDGLAAVFRIESHNRPSFVEPYQGAATGVGGIIRDVLALGARPVALLDSLRFGPPEDPRTRYLLTGVVAGIAGYGNAIGVPTVAGEVLFEPSYRTNPLVNVMCVGIARVERLTRAVAAGPGNLLVLIGARTGRDGIHGATFASAGLGADAERKRPAVQIGDPFAGKQLVEACLELVERGLVVGLQDMGAAGITSSCAETAYRAGTGVEVDVQAVPRREEGMTPYEVVLSESQERMLAVVEPERLDEVRRVCARRGVLAAPIGRVTDDGRFRVRDGDELVADLPVEALVKGAPVYEPEARPEPAPAFDPVDVPVPEAPAGLGEALLRLLAAPAIARKGWIYEQYDHMVQTNTVLRPGAADAAVLRVRGTRRGLAVKVDGSGRWTRLDPYAGGALAVCEAARNVSCTGARPLAMVDCLNFGNPERPAVYAQLREAVRGMADACRALGIPCVGGNVSLYNETEGRDIDPTPVVGVVGLLEDVAAAVGLALRAAGDLVVLAGWPDDALGGSEYLRLVHGVVAGPMPRLDLDRERRLQELVRRAVCAGLAVAAHDVADGGLAVALAEMAVAGGTGVAVDLPGEWLAGRRVDGLLFGEAPARAVLEVPEAAWPRLRELAAELDVPLTAAGRAGGDRLRVTGGGRVLVDEPLASLAAAWEEALPRWLSGSPVR